jgi:hypothetical protein
MLWLALSLTVSSSPKAAAGPPQSETAKLYFLAGDLAKATEWASRCSKTEPPVCQPLLRALAEYASLARRTDDFTPEQARDFLKWDHAISPGFPGKLSQGVIARFVTGPLTRAHQIAASDRTQARSLVEHVLSVDPANADAVKLKKALK